MPLEPPANAGCPEHMSGVQRVKDNLRHTERRFMAYYAGVHGYTGGEARMMIVVVMWMNGSHSVRRIDHWYARLSRLIDEGAVHCSLRDGKRIEPPRHSPRKDKDVDNPIGRFEAALVPGIPTQHGLPTSGEFPFSVEIDVPRPCDHQKLPEARVNLLDGRD
jgi:hypothetical protein